MFNASQLRIAPFQSAFKALFKKSGKKLTTQYIAFQNIKTLMWNCHKSTLEEGVNKISD